MFHSFYLYQLRYEIAYEAEDIRDLPLFSEIQFLGEEDLANVDYGLRELSELSSFAIIAIFFLQVTLFRFFLVS